MPTKVIMPQLGESVVEGTVSRWLKREGETVEEFEPLLEVSTDKVDTEIPAPAGGVVLKIYVEEGQTVERGVLLAMIGSADEQPENGDRPVQHDSHASVPSNHAVHTSVPHPEEKSANGGGHVPTRQISPTNPTYSGHVTPVVARMAAEHNLDLSQIKGTGRDGRITKKDVEAYLDAHRASQQTAQSASVEPAEKQPDPWDIPADGNLFKPTVNYEESAASHGAPAQVAPQSASKTPPKSPPPFTTQRPHVTAQPESSDAPMSFNRRVHPVEPIPEAADGELVALSPMRKAIAEHMVRSKLETSPHVTTVFEVDLSAVLAHRAAHKDDFAKRGVNLTLTAYFAAATVTALQQNPYLNAQWTDGGIYLHHAIHLGIAVAVDNGLLVPVIRNAQDLNLLGLARAVNDLASRARGKKLKPDELTGGTFSITNHGVSGSLFATPIINQPQVGILGVGVLEERVKVVNGAIAIRPCLYLSLTFDHRVVDGATGDSFLLTMKEQLEGWEA